MREVLIAITSCESNKRLLCHIKDHLIKNLDAVAKKAPRWQSEIIEFVIEIGKVIIIDWDWPNTYFEMLYN